MNDSEKTEHCQIGGAFYCTYLRKTIGIVVKLSDDLDTPIGFDCDFQICGNKFCEVLKKYPIGVKREYPLQKSIQEDNDKSKPT